MLSPLQEAGRVFSFVLVTLALAALVSGGGEDSENPQSTTPPNISISLGCIDGAPELNVINDGGPMSQQDTCILSYEDGMFDSLFIMLDEEQDITCRLSNLHGGVTAAIEGISLSESTGDCLAPAFEEMLQTFVDTLDFNGMMPMNLPEITILYCTYDCSLENVAHASPVVSVTRITGGMHVQVVYSDISADIIADTSDILCTDFTGTLSIDSIVYNADIMIVNQPGQPVSFELVNADVTINDLDIEIDGVFGILVNWLIDYFQSEFATQLEHEFEIGFGDIFRPLLLDIAVEEASCE